MQKLFVHHVFFWLNNSLEQTAVERFETALKKLVSIESIAQFHLGKPAGTSRDVIDSSYQYSLLTLFNSEADHDHYQVHPVHDEFRVIVGELCSKVLVYDSNPL